MKTIKNLLSIFIIITSLIFVSCENQQTESKPINKEPANVLVSCPQPTNLNISSNLITQATFSWNTGASESAWEVFIIPENLPAPTNTQTGVSTNVNSYAVTGLNPDTTYHCYVRAICSDGDHSEWAGPAVIN